jgi:hypothetical protein
VILKIKQGDVASAIAFSFFMLTPPYTARLHALPGNLVIKV